MTPAQITGTAPQALGIDGDLTAQTVPDLLGTLPVAAGVHRVDMTGVRQVDSAGLALLVGWQQLLNADQGQLELVGVPEGLLRLARISSVDTLLGLQATDAGDTGQ